MRPNPRPRIRPRAAALAALLLAGCALGPAITVPEPEAPSGWGQWHGGSPALLGNERRDAHLAPPLDWRAFADPVLDGLQARALAASPDLRTAALRFAQSRAQRDAAQARQWPQVGASAAVGRQRQSESGAQTRLVDAIAPSNRDTLIDALSSPFNLYQAGFDASWELDLWGRVRRLAEAADADSDAAAALLAQARLSLNAELARAYLELRAAQRQAALARDDAQAAAETLQLAEGRVRAGLRPDAELSRPRAAVAEARARLPALAQREAQALNQIALLCGERPGALDAQLAPLPPAADGPAPLPDLALGLPSELAGRRPDIRAAQARLRAAAAQAVAARAELYPRVTLGAGIGWESVDSGRFGDWGSRTWHVGPSISLPLFDGGQRRATVELRGLQQQEAAIAFQQTVLRAWHEVDDALNAYTAEQQRLAQLRLRAVEGRDALAMAQARERRGLADASATLEALRAQLQAERDEADSQARLGTALVAVVKALGA